MYWVRKNVRSKCWFGVRDLCTSISTCGTLHVGFLVLTTWIKARRILNDINLIRGYILIIFQLLLDHLVKFCQNILYFVRIQHYIIKDNRLYSFFQNFDLLFNHCFFYFPGIISIGNDLTQLFGAVILSYYAGRGHRPRWLAFGIFTVAIFCFLNALPHFLFGPGEDALQLTYEFGDDYQFDSSKNFTEVLKNKHLCNSTGEILTVIKWYLVYFSLSLSIKI